MPLCRSLVSLFTMVAAAVSASAHHGKDFLLLETDDMPLPGHVYAITSTDTLVDADGVRTTEITPGLLFGLGNRVAIEPHFHVARSADRSWHYDATAAEIRFASGNLPGSEWRTAVSLEGEKPRDSEENSGGQARLVLARTFPNMLFAANLIVDKDLAPHTKPSYSVGVGALTPLANGDRAGVEAILRSPLADGVEIVPGYYHSSGVTSVKLGVGVFTSSESTQPTLHASIIQRF